MNRTDGGWNNHDEASGFDCSPLTRTVGSGAKITMPTKEEADDATTRASVRILDGLTGNGYLDFSTGMHSESTVLGEEKGSFGVRLGG